MITTPRPIPYAFHPKTREEMLPTILCNWQALRAQLLLQWNKLTPWEIDKAGPHLLRLSGLIARKYDISARMIENYLRNFERTMPLTGHS